MRRIGPCCALVLLASQALGQALSPADGQIGDRFGASVALDGGLLLVGAPGVDPAGAAYVFRLQGGQWVQEQKLIGSEAQPGDAFGASVALDGEVLVVGAPGPTDGGTQSGSVYLFEPLLGNWLQRQRLTGAANAGWDYTREFKTGVLQT